jgi:hypothetical protein
VRVALDDGAVAPASPVSLRSCAEYDHLVGRPVLRGAYKGAHIVGAERLVHSATLPSGRVGKVVASSEWVHCHVRDSAGVCGCVLQIDLDTNARIPLI